MNEAGQFVTVIRQTLGRAPRPEEIVQGKLIRFATSDRNRDKAGWCKLFDDCSGGVFGCWRSDISETWQASSSRSSKEHEGFLLRVKQTKKRPPK